ncbi:purine-binding chemotaxis protein CheW [Microcoleus sp. FACHB-SPT15]|uniref:chemotaxis protein CheW n=1 Tax=Microcoleus sp. FACHB-SPT15 TaxID=2692830 RepID=UPI00177C2B60|nr:chemotaxis protein CheW [Microcoleus sp. FACHB-SPT15]MBD1807408.1 purine-binding chemotaxis protein CheW [Microcoleus sp. FACHB-SPT15]
MSDSLSIRNSLLPSTIDEINRVSPSDKASEQFLRFHLFPNTTALLPIQQLTEVLTISRDQIVPIFQMPPWVMGVYNWRGEILWMVDLGHLVGLTPWHQQPMSASEYPAIVLQTRANSTTPTNTNSQMLGIVVNQVEDIEWCNTDWIQSPPSSTVTPELTPFLRGYWLKPNGDMLVVIDGKAIIAAMPKL